MTEAPAPWWTRAVVYQVYPRSFADADGDGIGDLAGILGKLDYLAELGVDILWLSPIYASPQKDNGYDISDYQRIDPVFGTFADFDALVAGLHARGMKLVMDLVVNHTSNEHPWFLDSASSPQSPKRDWYWWRDPRMGFAPGEPGAEPTNWGSFFSGPTWTLDPASGQYYLHLFAREQPDLNWENPEVRAAVYEMMNWWLDRGVDGFRMDVINFISKTLPLADGAVPPGHLWGDGGPQFMSGPRIHEFLAEMHREVFAGREAELITVGEMPGVTVEEARLFTDPSRAEVDMVFQFEHVSLDQGPGGKWDYRGLDLRDLKTSWNRWQKGLADTGWNSLYLDNHDQPRLVSRFGDDGAYRYESATLWAALLHLHRGTPYIYQGEELGMTNVPFTSIEDFRDVESLNWYEEATMKLGRDPQDVLAALRRMSRDNARTPVQWTGGPQAGFTTGIPWIDVNPNYPSVNAELDRSSPRSVYRFYQRLIALRHGSAVVQRGRFELEQADHPVLYAFTRTLDGVVLRVLGNVSGEPLGLPPALGGGRLLLGNYGDDDAGTARGGSDDAHTAGSAAGHGRAGRVPAMEQDTLRPWEVRILDVS